MISQYLGFDSDYIIIGLSAVVLILLILIIVNIAQMRKLKKAYKVFMSGKNGKNLEDTLIKRLDQVDTLLAMLDVRNNGFIINAMHTREGCYTYIKEIVDGNSIIVLSDEEQKALDRAMGKTENNE